MKFCIDCNHYGRNKSCNRLADDNRNPVTGKINPLYILDADYERSNYEGVLHPVIVGKTRKTMVNGSSGTAKLSWVDRVFMWLFRIEQGEDWQSCGKDAIFFEDIDPIPTPLPFKPPSSES